MKDYSTIKLKALGDRDGPQTLRDQFAMAVLPSIYEYAMFDAQHGSGLFQDKNWRIGLAMDAYAMADAMLEARKK